MPKGKAVRGKVPNFDDERNSRDFYLAGGGCGIPTVPPGAGIIGRFSGSDFDAGRPTACVEHGSQMQLVVLSQRPEQLPAGQGQFIDENDRVFVRSFDDPVIDSPQARLVDNFPQRHIENLDAHRGIEPAVQRFVAGEKKILWDHRHLVGRLTGRFRVKNAATGTGQGKDGNKKTDGMGNHGK